MNPLTDVKGFLIDLDGVLYVGKEPVNGAAALLSSLDDCGIPYRFVSNSTRRCRRSVASRLSGLGYDIPQSSIFTPPLAAIKRIMMGSRRRCYLVTTGDVHLDFEAAGVPICTSEAEYVVMGDAGDAFTFDRLNRALRLIIDGAELLALEMDRYWRELDGLVLSTGPFVAAMEYATGCHAQVVGKPSKEFFEMALQDMGCSPNEAAMIGDDVITDVGGGKAAGMKGILVKTGKYRAHDEKILGVSPDLVLDSIVDLKAYL
jgi:HAD superfamily hydrolase (TIGR01458 family)